MDTRNAIFKIKEKIEVCKANKAEIDRLQDEAIKQAVEVEADAKQLVEHCFIVEVERVKYLLSNVYKMHPKYIDKTTKPICNEVSNSDRDKLFEEVKNLFPVIDIPFCTAGEDYYSVRYTEVMAVENAAKLKELCERYLWYLDSAFSREVRSKVVQETHNYVTGPIGDWLVNFGALNKGENRTPFWVILIGLACYEQNAPSEVWQKLYKFYWGGDRIYYGDYDKKTGRCKQQYELADIYKSLL